MKQLGWGLFIVGVALGTISVVSVRASAFVGEVVFLHHSVPVSYGWLAFTGALLTVIGGTVLWRHHDSTKA